MRETVGPLGPQIIIRLSYGKECEGCVEMSNERAAFLQKIVLKFVEMCKRRKHSEAVGLYGEKSWLKIDNIVVIYCAVADELKQWSTCYCGVRSIVSRYRAVAMLVRAMDRANVCEVAK